jgi:hypothetical protein
VGVLVPLAAGRAALLVVAAGILVLLVVFAAVIFGAAFAPRQQARESAARTLDLLLRAIPGYRPPPSDTRPAPTPRRPRARPEVVAGGEPASERGMSQQHVVLNPVRLKITVVP